MVQTSLTSWLSKANPPIPPSNPETPPPSASQTSSPPQAPAAEPPPQTPPPPPSQEPPPQPTTTYRPRRPLPSNVTLAPIAPSTLTSFRRLNSVILPVPYSERFYAEILSDPVVASLSAVALWADTPASKPRVVAGIRCRLLAVSPAAEVRSKRSGQPVADAAPSLYVATIATLSPFRGHGIASALLHRVIAHAAREYGVTTVSAHVWEGNVEVWEWYSVLGFTKAVFEEEYYKKLRPGGAWVLERPVRVTDLLDADADADAAGVGASAP